MPASCETKVKPKANSRYDPCHPHYQGPDWQLSPSEVGRTAILKLGKHVAGSSLAVGRTLGRKSIGAGGKHGVASSLAFFGIRTQTETNQGTPKNLHSTHCVLGQELQGLQLLVQLVHPRT